MAGYIIVDVKTRKILIPAVLISILLFVLGIIIGYFSAPRTSGTAQTQPSSSCNMKSAITNSCPLDRNSQRTNTYLDRYLERDLTTCMKDPVLCNTYKLPRTYNAYHLKGKQIVIDGRLDDEAWQEVHWTEKFVDMRSEVYPAPYFDTKVKIRWDDTSLYVGIYVQENNLWATLTEHDSSIWRENGFDMLVEVDGSMFNYKQMQINALGTMMDQVLVKSPHDAGTRLMEWHTGANSAVYTEGTINTPGDQDKFWTAEMSFTFEALASNSTRQSYKPDSGEVWFLNFGRSEHHLNVTSDNTYIKDKGVPTDWWSWQPCGAINLHLQDRWGLVQFKTDAKDESFTFDRWHIYRALFDILDAEKKYNSLNAGYTDNLAELDIPPYLMTEVCVDIPEIVLTKRDGQWDFSATVKSRLIPNLSASIRSDRYVTFN